MDNSHLGLNFCNVLNPRYLMLSKITIRFVLSHKLIRLSQLGLNKVFGSQISKTMHIRGGLESHFACDRGPVILE